MEQMSYEEMMAKHRRLCCEVDSCADCEYEKENSNSPSGGCFAKWMYEVLAGERDKDLSFNEEF